MAVQSPDEVQTWVFSVAIHFADMRLSPIHVAVVPRIRRQIDKYLAFVVRLSCIGKVQCGEVEGIACRKKTTCEVQDGSALAVLS